MNLCKSGAQMGWVNNNKKSIFSFFASAIAASPKLLTKCQNCHFCTYTLHMVYSVHTYLEQWRMGKHFMQLSYKKSYCVTVSFTVTGFVHCGSLSLNSYIVYIYEEKIQKKYLKVYIYVHCTVHSLSLFFVVDTKNWKKFSNKRYCSKKSDI